VAATSTPTAVPSTAQQKTATDGNAGFADARPDDKPNGPKDPFDPVDFNKKNHPDKQDK
jgi:hypothetical protein